MRMKLIFETKDNKLVSVRVIRDYDNFSFFYAERERDRIIVMQREFGTYLKLSVEDFANSILKILIKKEILEINGVSKKLFDQVKNDYNVKLTKEDIKKRIDKHYKDLENIERKMIDDKINTERRYLGRKSSYTVAYNS